MENPIVGLPAAETNQADAVGGVSAEKIGRDIIDYHRKGLRSRRFADLTREKYLLHIDGEGFAQFLDLYDGQRLRLPPNLTGMPRMQENLLRPIVDHMVAYHTAQNFQFVTDTKDSREDRERALVDQVWANHLASKQQLNTVVAAGLYMACGAGHAPVHAFWRNAVDDTYEPIMSGEDQYPVRGMIDFFVGDPFSTVYHNSSKRGSIPLYTYERVLPAQRVRDAFPGVPLEGSNKLSSVSRYVRTVRNWMVNDAFIHGFGGMISGEGQDELISLVFQEIAPFVDPNYPDGLLRIVALNGSAEISQDGGSNKGSPVLLHEGPLPGGVLSSVQIYSLMGGRQDDVMGKPFVADIDDLQMELNQALSERKAYLMRAVGAPLVTESPMDQDTDVWEQDAQLEVEPGTQMAPFFLEPPSKHIPAMNAHIEELRQAIWTQGGYNAASRGESHSGDAASKVRMLSQLDDEQHGPTNQYIRRSVEELMGIGWRLMKQYGDIPWVIDSVGTDHAHIVGRYIDRSSLSESPPTFRIVSGVGATPDAKIEQLIQMVQLVGADGEPLLTTAEFKQNFPDKQLYSEAEDPIAVRKRRPKFINNEIRRQTDEMLKGMAEQGAAPEMMEAFAPAMEEMIHSLYPVLPDDVLMLHVQELGNITQDENENRIVRRIAGLRQARYRALIQQQQMAQARARQEQEPDRQSQGAG